MKKGFLFLILMIIITGTAMSQLIISGLPPKMAKGDSVQLTAMMGTPPFAWSSSDTTIVKVNPTSGLAVAVGVGSVMINAVDGLSAGASLGTNVYHYKVAIPDTSFKAEKKIDVPVYISSLAGLNVFSAQMQFSFDTTKVRLLNINKVNSLSASADLFYSQNGSLFSVALASGDPLTGTNPVLFYLHFEAKDTNNYNISSPITISSFFVNEPGPENPSGFTKNGSVFIQQPTNLPPSFTSVISEISINEGTLYSFQFQASDPNNNIDHFELTNLLPSPEMEFTSSTGLFQWTPNYNRAGDYNFSVKVIDAFGYSVSHSFIVHVINVNRNPVITSTFPDTVHGKEGVPLMFNITATDPDGNAVKYQLLFTPPNASIDSLTGAFVWTPAFNQSGKYFLTFRAYDSLGGQNQLGLHISIADSNRTPVFTTFPNDTTIRELQSLNTLLQATDPDGDPLRYGFQSASLPAVFVLDSISGSIFAGTNSVSEGVYTITLTATDRRPGGFITRTFTLTVLDSNRAPIIGKPFPPSFSIAEGQYFTFTFNGNDPDGDHPLFSLVNQPAGMTIQPDSGIIRWTPSYNDSGLYNFIVRLTDPKGLFDTAFCTLFVQNINRPPVFTSVPIDSTAIARFTQVTFQYAATDADGDTLRYQLMTGPPGASLSIYGLFTWTPGFSDSNDYMIGVKVKELNDSTSFSLDGFKLRVIRYGDVSTNGLIQAFDASLILQSLVGRITLSALQNQVANVSTDQTVSAFDASLILRYVVGNITSFPNGLGKFTVPTEAASTFSFRIEKGKTDGTFDLVVALNKPSQAYGMDFSIGFDSTLVAATKVSQETITDSMTMSYHFPSGSARVAFAGIQPLTKTGDVARFSFALKDPRHTRENVVFTVNKFILNETDVTKDVGAIILEVKNIIDIPSVFALEQNYPNPFNPTTAIRYQLAKESKVSVTIFNILGQPVRTLVRADQEPGYYSLQWDGRDKNDALVSSGIYLYRLEAVSSDKSTFVSTKKMILMK